MFVVDVIEGIATVVVTAVIVAAFLAAIAVWATGLAVVFMAIGGG